MGRSERGRNSRNESRNSERKGRRRSKGNNQASNQNNKAQSTSFETKQRKTSAPEKVSKTGKFTTEEYAEFLHIKGEIAKLLQHATTENLAAVSEFSRNADQGVCSICSRPIAAPEDAISALTDRSGEKKAHFDCVLQYLTQVENCAEDERIAYIGQGKFAVVSDESIEGDKSAGGAKHTPGLHKIVKIKKTIEWERPNNPLEWRHDIAALFSQVN